MWTISEVLEGGQGQLEGGCLKETTCDGFSIDSRTVKKNDLFFALSGPHFDGHAFVADALERGGMGAVVSRAVFQARREAWRSLSKTHGFILVEDPLSALQSLAKWHRRRFDVPVVGVTGSNGKTTTKEMAAAILARRGAVLKTEGNFNNHIGLPLTLLRLNHTHTAAVVEMGINQRGEMPLLCKIAQPTIGLITNIGPAHLEGLGSLEGVSAEKGLLFEAIKSKGAAIINQDDPFLAPWKARVPRSWTFGLSSGPKSADITADHIVLKKDHSTFTLHQNRAETSASIRLPVPGKHHVSNALAASAVAASLGFNLEAVSEGLGCFQSLPQRTEILDAEKCTILFDAYNANPASVKAALDLLAGTPLPSGKRIAVLGDMLELGDFSDAAHVEIGKYAANKGIDRLIAVGRYADQIAAGAREGSMKTENTAAYPELSGVETRLWRWAKPGDLTLIKGSRGMKMERLLPALGWPKTEKGGRG